MPETGLRACFENSGCGWLGGGAVAGEAAGQTMIMAQWT